MYRFFCWLKTLYIKGGCRTKSLISILGRYEAQYVYCPFFYYLSLSMSKWSIEVVNWVCFRLNENWLTSTYLQDLPPNICFNANLDELISKITNKIIEHSLDISCSAGHLWIVFQSHIHCRESGTALIFNVFKTWLKTSWMSRILA